MLSCVGSNASGKNPAGTNVAARLAGFGLRSRGSLFGTAFVQTPPLPRRWWTRVMAVYLVEKNCWQAVVGGEFFGVLAPGPLTWVMVSTTPAEGYGDGGTGGGGAIAPTLEGLGMIVFSRWAAGNAQSIFGDSGGGAGGGASMLLPGGTGGGAGGMPPLRTIEACEAALGVICMPNDDCRLGTQDFATLVGGTYQGSGTHCGDTACGPCSWTAYNSVTLVTNGINITDQRIWINPDYTPPEGGGYSEYGVRFGGKFVDDTDCAVWMPNPFTELEATGEYAPTSLIAGQEWFKQASLTTSTPFAAGSSHAGGTGLSGFADATGCGVNESRGVWIHPLYPDGYTYDISYANPSFIWNLYRDSDSGTHHLFILLQGQAGNDGFDTYVLFRGQAMCPQGPWVNQLTTDEAVGSFLDTSSLPAWIADIAEDYVVAGWGGSVQMSWMPTT